ncbi:MAG: hypothetical protein ABI874_01210 [Chloroflexota bacterium]
MALTFVFVLVKISKVGIEQKQMEHTLRRTVEFRLPAKGRPVASSVNRGVPPVLDEPDHSLSKHTFQIADALSRTNWYPTPQPFVSV